MNTRESMPKIAELSEENCVMIKVNPTADPTCGFYIVKRKYANPEHNLNWEDESEWEVYNETSPVKSYMLTHEQAEKLYNYDESEYWWNVTREEREMSFQPKWVPTNTYHPINYTLVDEDN